ncbi:MAG: aspartate carbamoyltransferase [Bacteroidales bacterium]|nr:aspartate carbamoyltransferase [Bacteroidales bacterium]
MNPLTNRSLVSICDFNTEEQLSILDMAEDFEKNPNQDLLKGYVVATLFFEPSTRTRLSFDSAASRLGARVIGFSESSSSSVSKGETLKDTILTVSNYSDIIVMRHPKEGSARYASEVSPVPIVNAGDGANQHPTQCLLDLYSIRKTQGRLEGINIAFVGDLKYGRTVHSLVIALCNHGATFHLVSPPALQLPEFIKWHIRSNNLTYREYEELDQVLSFADIIYMTRVQRERFADPIEYEKVKNAYVLRSEMLGDTKNNLRIMHPLPRVNEISQDVDESEKAYYFHQALNGVYIRQAILTSILGAK